MEQKQGQFFNQCLEGVRSPIETSAFSADKRVSP